MTVGIYALYWWKQDLIYIGQSLNIEARFLEHLRMLRKSKHTNYKVQSAYEKYGKPSLEILSTCKLDSLNEEEIYWTKEFDSINNGLNIIEAGRVGYGVNSNASKYSKLQILKVFRRLYLSSDTYDEIAKYSGVSKDTVSDIRYGVSHIWLKAKYPKQYSLLTGRVATVHRLNKYVNNPVHLISPTGEIHIVTNIDTFARENNLDSRHIGAVIRKNRRIHKGWRLGNQ